MKVMDFRIKKANLTFVLDLKIIKIAKVFPGLVAVFLIARKILSYCNSSRKDCYNIKYQIDIDAFKCYYLNIKRVLPVTVDQLLLRLKNAAKRIRS